MPYSPQTWVDGTAGGTPLSSARLNTMEAGIAASLSATEPAFITARQMNAQDGSSSLSSFPTTALMMEQVLHKATQDSVIMTWRVPTGITSVKFEARWAGLGAGTGVVALRGDYLKAADGTVLNTGNVLGATVTPTVTAQYTLQTTTLVNAISVAAGDVLGLKVFRLSSNGGDTYASDIGLVGVRLTGS